MNTTTDVTKPAVKTNAAGLVKKDYSGSKSTLCSGCGHDSVTNHIISAFFQSGISPYQVAKMSGIGCSSKTPTYFLGKSHGFNSLHGRMAPVATGAKIANKDLVMIGVSGDGDTASIGMGGFAHLIRRNLPVVYIIENNGVYGLTKGQFSATADEQSKLKNGDENPFAAMDMCSLAIELGCGFVARSFSGDGKQLVPLIGAALKHQGTAVIDVVSPCVTFNNHDGSTKGYNYVKDNKVALQELGFIQELEDIKVDYSEGDTQKIEMADGSILTLKKLLSDHHNVHDGTEAIRVLRESRSSGEVLTGLFYFNRDQSSLIDQLNIGDKPLFSVDESSRPSKAQLNSMLEAYR